jgi:Uma2 family endonuclease
VATEVVPPNLQIDDDTEHYELLNGRMVRKASVGRKKHSQVERIIWAMLEPYRQKLGGSLEMEWTMLNGPDRVIPDVTFSFPEPKLSDGYLIAPAFLVVETASKDQSLSSLLKKCRDRYHPFGTPYCWVIDSEEEAAYECHKSDNGLFRLVDVLTAGSEIKVSVAEIFEELKKQS